MKIYFRGHRHWQSRLVKSDEDKKNLRKDTRQDKTKSDQMILHIIFKTKLKNELNYIRNT